MKKTWTHADDQLIRRYYGHLPATDLAQMLGTTPTAVKVRRKRLGWTWSMTGFIGPRGLARLMGLDIKTAMDWLATLKVPRTRAWLGDTAVWMTTMDRLTRWLEDPLNHWALDPGRIDKIQDPWLKLVAQEAEASFHPDRWLISGQIQASWFLCQEAVARPIRDGRVPAIRRGNNYRIQLSEAIKYWGQPVTPLE